MKTMEEIEWIGERRQTKVYNFLANWYSSYPEYVVYNNSRNHAGPDFLITKSGKPFAVIEVTNYQQSSNMTNHRLLRYIANMTRYKCYRLLVLSYPENLRYANYSYRKNLIQPKSDSERIRVAERLLAKHGINVSYFEYQD